MAATVLLLTGLNVEFPAGVMAWVEQGLRWLHFLAGITWIGMLYFFNLVSMPVMKELDDATRGKVIPNLMPRALWWFRWGAVWNSAGWAALFHDLPDARRSQRRRRRVVGQMGGHLVRGVGGDLGHPLRVVQSKQRPVQ